MSFGSNFNTIIQGDSSLTGYCTGGIYYENLPDNYSLTKNWLVYSFQKSEQTNCLDSKNAYTTYALTCKLVCHDTGTLETISDYLTTLLNGSTEDGIQDITFRGDIHSVDLEKGIYINSLDFDSFYVA